MNKRIFGNPVYRNLFLGLSLGIFVVLATFLYVFNLVPQELASGENNSKVTEEVPSYSPEYAAAPVLPMRVVISSVGINTSVSHPTSPDVTVLDNALLSGAVYYPGSGSLVSGNAFVFGHSTGLSVVRNQAFKAFNNLKKVTNGTEIEVYGDDGQVYVYESISTELVDENSAFVEFNTTDRMITLSTCNTFGAKEDRHVVKAIFKRVYTPTI